jgi:hypothetical protein
MIKQEIICYPDSFNIKEYKEFLNDELIVHTKYDEHNNKVYLYLAYENLQWERIFDEDSSNSEGRIIYFKQNNGVLKIQKSNLTLSIVEPEDMRTTILNALHYNKSYDMVLVIRETSDFCLDNPMVLGLLMVTQDGYQCKKYYEVLPNGDSYIYVESGKHFIYKHEDMTKFISVNQFLEQTQYLDLLTQAKIHF